MRTKTISTLAAIALLGFVTQGQAKSPAIGSNAPSFSLTDTNGKTHSLSDFKDKFVVLEWTNHGCPFVKKHYDTGNMQALQKDFTAKGVIWLSICSSGKGKEGYMSPAEWNKMTAEKAAAPTAVLLDEEGKVGKSYEAKTTPHMFIINPKGELIYKGAIDDKPTFNKDDIKEAINYVKEALDEALAGKPVSIDTTDAYGCSVKYKK